MKIEVERLQIASCGLFNFFRAREGKILSEAERGRAQELLDNVTAAMDRVKERMQSEAAKLSTLAK